jgi:chromosome segregation ATPase
MKETGEEYSQHDEESRERGHMSTELPKDPIAAMELLVSLEEKDKDETRCNYPTCQELRQVTSRSGRPSAYCVNARHNAVTNHRARQQLRFTATGTTPEVAAKREQVLPLGVANVESLRQSVVSGMQQLQGNLDRYVTLLSDIADPDISVAQILASQDRADSRIAEVQQSLSAERSLRLAAEATSSTARKDAAAEREAAELAIQHMEEAEARTQRIEAEAAQRIEELQREQEATLERERTERQQHIEKIEQQANETVAVAHGKTILAQEEARKADTRAHDAEAEARTQAITAERLVNEARATLERERAEVDRLRTDLANARSQAEAERVEARANREQLQRELASVRSQVETERTEARATLERERAEVDRLRTDLANAHAQIEQVAKRADQLADQLTQLVKAQFTDKGNQKQE